MRLFLILLYLNNILTLSSRFCSIYSKELGSFKYKLKVTCLPQSNMQSMTFDVPLGSTQTELFRFKVFNTSPVTFNCGVTKPDFFTVAKSLPVEAAKGWDGVDASVSIVFEPTSIGEVRDIITLSSPEGGEYTCELIAKCQAPLPQGPFAFKQGVSVDIPFRNCFTSQTNWSFNVDSPTFRITSSTASVAAKSEGKVSVVFEASGAPPGVVSAKLFVRCESKPELPPWVFYLRGVVEAPDPNAPVAATAAGGKKK
jgi:hydrocephalus-inducing protein